MNWLSSSFLVCFLFVFCVHGTNFVPFVLDYMIENDFVIDFKESHEVEHLYDSLYKNTLAISNQFNSTLKPIPSFITSTSIDTNNLEQESQLVALNITNCRVYCTWRYLTSTLTEIESFTVEELRSNTSWIEPYSATLNWEGTDYQVQNLLQNGIQPIIEIGEGTDHCLPTVSSIFNSTSGVADPKTVGESQYLAYMYRYCRAVVHRYKSYVTIWQIENELNDAYLQAVSHLRSPSNIDPNRTPWGNFTYVTEVLSTIYLAVKDEDPSLWTTQNLVADVPEDVYQIAHVPIYYLDALEVWDPLMDMVSFDVYPNYYLAYPIYDNVLSNITEKIRERLTNPDKPIMVAETGTHVMDASSIAANTLNPVNFTGDAQGEYLAASFEATYKANIKGFQVFKLSENSGFSAPEGGYSNQDVKFLQACTDSVVQNTIQPLIDWVLSLRDIKYILSGRAIEVATAPTTSSFGILDINGNFLPGFNVLHELYSHLPQ